MRKIASHYALINGSLERGIVVEVDNQGTITNITRHDNIDNIAGVEFYPGILIPGMINMHCHLELSYLRGAIAEATGFAGFAREIGRVRGNYSNEERLRAASVADSEMWREGVEAVCDIANDALIMPVKESSKIEYHTLFEAFGLLTNSIDTQQAINTKRKTNNKVINKLPLFIFFFMLSPPYVRGINVPNGYTSIMTGRIIGLLRVI
jgi:hypothetical protein